MLSVKITEFCVSITTVSNFRKHLMQKVCYMAFTGHRYKPSHEFGFVSLDILYMYPEDSGVYTCRASNLYGTVETSSEVKCRGMVDFITK